MSSVLWYIKYRNSFAIGGDIHFMEVEQMDYKLKVDKRATGLNIYRLLENSRLTKEEIAEFLELNSPRVIYDWTSGIKLPSTENLFNLAKLFNVQVEDILAI